MKYPRDTIFELAIGATALICVIIPATFVQALVALTTIGSIWGMDYIVFKVCHRGDE